LKKKPTKIVDYFLLWKWLLCPSLRTSRLFKWKIAFSSTAVHLGVEASAAARNQRCGKFIWISTVRMRSGALSCAALAVLTGGTCADSAHLVDCVRWQRSELSRSLYMAATVYSVRNWPSRRRWAWWAPPVCPQSTCYFALLMI
jgi:hypothetical protein